MKNLNNKELGLIQDAIEGMSDDGYIGDNDIETIKNIFAKLKLSNSTLEDILFDNNRR